MSGTPEDKKTSEKAEEIKQISPDDQKKAKKSGTLHGDPVFSVD
jgi:hypothetical protein